MTVSSTNTREFNLDQLMRRAMQTAGIMGFEEIADQNNENWRQRAAFGRDQLDLIMDRLQAEGVILRDVERYAITLTAGTASYALPADTIDIHEDGTYQETTSSPETAIIQIDREEYDGIANKTFSAQPTRFWLERLGICTVYLHPTPSVSNSQIFVRRKKMLADNSLGTYTPDLERYWGDYMHYELAFRFSVGMPLEERALLKSEASEAKITAQNYARQFVPNQMFLDHPTGWS